jgi:hypothetical protein
MAFLLDTFRISIIFLQQTMIVIALRGAFRLDQTALHHHHKLK